MRILVVATRQIGDVLLATPLLHALALRGDHVEVLVFKSKGGMLEGNQDCKKIIEIEEKPSVRQYLSLIVKIFRRYDLAISTLAGDRPTIYSWLASKKRAGPIEDLSWKSFWKRLVYKVRVDFDGCLRHTLIQNLMLAEVLGYRSDTSLVPPKSDASSTIISDKLEGKALHKKFAVLHPYPMWRYKQWTIDGWRSLISYLLSLGYESVLVTGGGSESEKTYVNSITQGFDTGVVDLTGETTFADAAYLLKMATLYVGPDTAMTHLAAAVGTNVVALYGPSNPVKWGPWPYHYSKEMPWKKIARPFQKRANVVLIQGAQPTNRASCVPCYGEGCNGHKDSKSECIELLSLSEVIKAIESFSL
jgi:heptosyltransferase-3